MTPRCKVTFPAFRLEYTRHVTAIAFLPGNGISASSLYSRRDLANMQFSDSQYQTSSAAPWIPFYVYK